MKSERTRDMLASYELTTPAGTITATTEVELAGRWIAQEHGLSWDADCGPFTEHTTVWEYVEALDLVRDGALDGYELSESVAA